MAASTTAAGDGDAASTRIEPPPSLLTQYGYLLGRSISGGSGSSDASTSGEVRHNAGGSEVHRDWLPHARLREFFATATRGIEMTTVDMIRVINSVDGHKVAPAWMETKEVGIDGRPLTEDERRASPWWRTRYARELDIGDAVVAVKQRRLFEHEHDLLSLVNRVRRRLGRLAPLDEHAARRDAMQRWQRRDADNDDNDDAAKSGDGDATEELQPGMLRVVPAVGGDGSRPRGSADSSSSNNDSSSSSAVGMRPWSALMSAVRSGQPMLRVMSEARQRVDCYDMDSYLDSTASLVWLAAKCGFAIGLAQGTARTVRMVNIDMAFLHASRTSVLLMLNLNVGAAALRWGGSLALVALAFCAGDAAMWRGKHWCMPAHDARRRTMSNYVAGFACAGALAGVLPYWMLADVHMAARMSVMGATVGGCLGVVVGLLLRQLYVLNVSRLQVTNRQLRRYEALMMRTREWAAQEQQRRIEGRTARVWW